MKGQSPPSRKKKTNRKEYGNYNRDRGRRERQGGKDKKESGLGHIFFIYFFFSLEVFKPLKELSYKYRLLL